jgi:hypothetical protein
VDSSAIFTSSVTRNLGPQFGVGSTIDALDTIEVNSVGALNELATPWYSDQILPFDVTLAGANEYGAMAAAKIFGLEILNEGTGHSIDDAVSEMQATFVARAIEPMHLVSSSRLQQKTRARAGEARARRAIWLLRPARSGQVREPPLPLPAVMIGFSVNWL